MSHHRAWRHTLLLAGAPLLFVSLSAAAQVAPGNTGIDNSGNYKSEVAACKSGATQQDLATCMIEARNAQAEKRRGQLDVQADGQLALNAAARCDALTGDEKTACHARMKGLGNTTGSVAGGGVLREVETVAVPPGSTSVTIEPKTANPVLIAPAQ
jgi:hypothetical protein